MNLMLMMKLILNWKIIFHNGIHLHYFMEEFQNNMELFLLQIHKEKNLLHINLQLIII